LLVPNLGLFALGVDLRNHFVKVRASVHVLPQRLTVLGVITAGVELLGAVVNKWNSSAGKRKDHSVF
jgi:hypothetical protein